MYPIPASVNLIAVTTPTVLINASAFAVTAAPITGGIPMVTSGAEEYP